MAAGLTKTQLIRHLAEKTELNNKTAAAFLEHLADTAIKETKKSGVFVVPGLGRLVKAIAGKDRIATMSEANHITLITIDLFEPFDEPLHTDVARFGYYERELEIWVEAKNVEKLQETAQGIAKVWRKLRPAVEDRSGEETVKGFDLLLIELRHKSKRAAGRLDCIACFLLCKYIGIAHKMKRRASSQNGKRALGRRTSESYSCFPVSILLQREFLLRRRAADRHRPAALFHRGYTRRCRLAVGLSQPRRGAAV